MQEISVAALIAEGRWYELQKQKETPVSGNLMKE
jgi:hypothetical protein